MSQAVKTQRDLKVFSIILCFVIFPGSGCLGARAKVSISAGASTEAKNARKIKKLLQQGNTFFIDRDRFEFLEKSIQSYLEIIEINSENVEARVLLARAYEFAGSLETLRTQERKPIADWYAAGLGVAREALNLALPGTVFRLQKKQFDEVFSEIEPQHIEVFYWYTVLLWRWAGTQGKATQLAVRKEVLRLLNYLIEVNPLIGGAGPYRLLGELYAVLPSFTGGSQTQAQSYFEKSFELAPNALANRASFAKTYAEPKDTSLAISVWQQMINANPEIPPTLAPENRLAQSYAEFSLRQETPKEIEINP